MYCVKLRGSLLNANNDPDDYQGYRMKQAHKNQDAAAGVAMNSEVFSFTIADNKVSAASMQWGTLSVTLPVSGSTKYSVSGNEVVASYNNTVVAEEIHFADYDADGLYNIVSHAQIQLSAPQDNWLGIVMREQLNVTLDSTGTAVTAVNQLLWNGNERTLFSSSVSDRYTTWSLQNGLLVETHTGDNGNSYWEIFRDGNTDGIYTEVASGTGTLISLTGVISQTDAVASSL